MKELYLFSGLGADERAFSGLDLTGYKVKYVKWILPKHGETIEEYALRLSAQITAPDPILIGLSFGGMVAIEIAKQIKTKKTILIASVKTKQELPLYFRVAGWLKLHKLVPVKLVKWPNRLIDWLFGIENSSEKKLLASIMIDTDLAFLKWAIVKVITWDNTVVPENVFHIHGTNDRLLPFRNVFADVKIKDGGHFMIVNNSKDLTSAVRKLIE